MSLLCRLCLCSIRNKRQTPLKNEQLRAMMERVFCFVVADEDHFPAEVCWKCFCWVRDFSWFSQRVQAVQELLNREYIFGNTSLAEASHVNPKRSALASADDTEMETRYSGSFIEDDTVGQDQIRTTFCPDITPEDEEQMHQLDAEPVLEALDEESDYFSEDIAALADLVKMESGRKINTFTDIESLVETEHARDFEKTMATMATDYRLEGELLDEVEVPSDADAQIQTVGKENGPAKPKPGTRPIRTLPIVPRDELPRSEHDSDALIKQFLEYKCELCPNPEQQRSYDTFYDLRLHYEEVHDTPGYMRCCNRKFHRRNWLKEHINHHLGLYRCKTCDKLFSAQRTLRWHEENMHKEVDWLPEPEERTFECGTCGYTCTNAKALSSHKQSHKKKPCPLCKNLYNANSLKTHMQNMHDVGDLLICEMCGHRSYSKQRMDKHKMLTHGIVGNDKHVVVNCRYCGKAFQRAERLRAHIIFNHTQKGQTFQCDICGRNYPNSRALYEHKTRIHSTKSFPCEYCGKVFGRKIYLSDHLSTHTGIRKYECKICGVKYSSRGNIANHRKRKHPELVKREKDAPGTK
ncbi:GDNF-inducible zinc finger protein 1-like [Anopheles bellator]|uniref:GDNF-inducible zinc finger protein 1-like n=1 Tax=Anopheles bellator TaxID=139047 RepID=UPI00264765A0|nr:GDNF-inducible zinc finger protein 1-like [Anopheles bellator]